MTGARLTFILGGVRSGKSARAVQLADELRGAGRVLFVATGEALDDEMRRRIDVHRADRPPAWDTLEAPREVAGDLARALGEPSQKYSVVLIDCLTLWVSNVLCDLPEDADVEAELVRRTRELLDVRGGNPGSRWIAVSNEVGLGIVPPTLLGRRYRDALGRCNQLVAAAADEVILMIAGLETRLK